MLKNYILIVGLVAVLAASTLSQNVKSTAKTAADAALITAASTPLDLADKAVEAHGGQKLRAVKTLVMKGSADLNVGGQQLPGAFSIALSGDKYYFEINSIAQQFKQIYNGSQFYSSIPGFSLPPVTSVGFPVLQHVGESGYITAALPESAKKKIGFRLTTPEGFYTDFYLDEKTSRVKGYESKFAVNGRDITTTVEIDDVQVVDGVVVPSKYSQRFDLGGLTAYAGLRSKIILVNSMIEDSAFAIPK